MAGIFFMAGFRRSKEHPRRASLGPAALSLAGGLLAIAAVLLMPFSPMLLAGTAAVLAGAAIGVAALDRRKPRPIYEPAETWEQSATRIGEFFCGLETEPEAGIDRFQTLLLSQARPTSGRLH